MIAAFIATMVVTMLLLAAFALATSELEQGEPLQYNAKYVY